MNNERKDGNGKDGAANLIFKTNESESGEGVGSIGLRNMTLETYTHAKRICLER